MEDWEKEILDKYDNNEDIPERTLLELVCNYIDEEIIDEERWFLTMRSIVCVGDRYFSIVWGKDKGEMCDHDFTGSKLTEVRKVKKLVEVEDWEEV